MFQCLSFAAMKYRCTCYWGPWTLSGFSYICEQEHPILRTPKREIRLCVYVCMYMCFCVFMCLCSFSKFSLRGFR